MKNLKLLWLSVGLGVILFSTPAFPQSIQQILSNGPTNKRINMVFLSEGYTSAQLSQYLIDAESLLNYILVTQPFSEYKTYFNAFAISVASVDSGSDHPESDIYRNTYFNSTYDSYGIQRAITIPPNNFDPVYANGQGKVFALLASLMPEYDIVILIVNDPEYGGTGGAVAITSMHPAAPEVVVHEVGHSFGDLGDEYDYPGGTTAENPNTTQENRREFIRWKTWILESTPIPTPEEFSYADVVGLFEGAAYQASGWDRPKLDCEMQSLFVPFCEVCAEALIKSKYNLINAIDSFSPLSGTIALVDTDSVALEIVPLLPTNHQLSIEWLINNSPVAGANSPIFKVYSYELGNGSHQVKAQVKDTTWMVRDDPSNLLKDSKVWTVNVSGLCAAKAGDANGTGGTPNLTDIVYLVNYVFKGGPAPSPSCRGDANASGGNGNLTDVIYLVNYVFKGGLAPIKSNVCCL